MNRTLAHIIIILAIVASAIFPKFAFSQNNDELESAVDTEMVYSPDYLPTMTGNFPTVNFNPIVYKNIDTALFHTIEYDPLWANTNLYQSIGINGQAHKPLIFTTNRKDGFSMIHLPYPLYFRTFDDIKLYDLKTSFTDIRIYYGLVEEISFKATHAQRIRNLNFSLNMDGSQNPGYFINQNVNRFNLDAVVRYETPKKNYGFILGYIFNHNKLKENGGLENSVSFTDRSPKGQKIENILSNFPVMFSNGSSIINTHSGQLMNYVNFKNKNGKYLGTISHSFNFDNYDIGFSDYELNNLFYVNKYYISTDSTNDSVQYYKISNTIQWSNYTPIDTKSTHSYYFRFAGGVRHEYTNAVSPKYIGNSLTAFGRTSIRLFKVWELYGDIAYDFFGYNRNDATATAGARFTINNKQRHFINFEVSFDRFSPDYIYSFYTGNNNLWENELKKENSFHADAYWSIFDYKIGFSFYNIGNYVHLNNNFVPVQSENQIQIIQLTGFAPLRIRDFSLDAIFGLQHSTNPSIKLPLFTGKLSAAYHTRIFRKRLHFQIGLDLFYNTKYYSDGYNPIMHQFFTQNIIVTGNYLYINAHLALQVKRLAFYIRGGNLIAGLLSFRYITTPGYPMQGRNMEIGVSWKFYD